MTTQDTNTRRLPSGVAYDMPLIDGQRVATAEYLSAVTADWDIAAFVRDVTAKTVTEAATTTDAA